jgi:hypothetical protein
MDFSNWLRLVHCLVKKLEATELPNNRASARSVSLVFMFGFPSCEWLGQFACSLPLSDHWFDAGGAADQQIAVFENGRDAAEGVPEPAFPCIGLARAKRVDVERLVKADGFHDFPFIFR